MSGLLDKYKFYLSFENCLCNDYVTEKFWKLYESDKIFKMNLVSVVRGAKEEQYKSMVKREGSFYINANNFGSAKALAEYLLYLNRNDTAYLEFFKWKIDLYKDIKDVVVNRPGLVREHKNVTGFYHLREPFCEICSKLHNHTYLNSSSTNKVWKISEWFNKKIDCWDKDEERVLLYKFVKFFGYCF